MGQIGAAPEGRLACYNRALAIDPLYAVAHVNRGAKLEQMARWSEASAAIEAAIAADLAMTSNDEHTKGDLGVLARSALSGGRPHWSEHVLSARTHARLGGEPHGTLGSELASRELHAARIKFKVMAGGSRAERQQAARELQAVAEAWQPTPPASGFAATHAAARWAGTWIRYCSACG